MKRFSLLLLVAGFTFLTANANAIDLDAGDAVKGKDAMTSCRTCHDGGSAKKISPAHKTMKQWVRYFDKDLKKLRRKHNDWDSYGYSDNSLQDTFQFLYAHALDSAQPKTCN